MQQTAPPTPRVHPQPMDGDPAPDLLTQIFRSISALKSAYARLQEAHTPYDPARVQAADRDVVRELVRLSDLKRAYREARGPDPGPPPDPILAAELEEQLRLLRTYEVVVGRFRAQILARDAEILQLRDRVRLATQKKLALSGHLRRPNLRTEKQGGNSVDFSSQEFDLGGEVLTQKSKYDVSIDFSSLDPKLGETSRACEEGASSSPKLRSLLSGPQAASVARDDACDWSERAELLEKAAAEARRAVHGFSKLLVNMMKEAGWDVDVAAGAVEPAVVYSKRAHKKFAFDAFLFRKMFAGFEMGKCVGGDPDSEFAEFCREKFLSLVHPKMEGAFFGNLDQRAYVEKGGHPKTPFYHGFVKMAKSVWLLTRLASSFGGRVRVFQVDKGSEFKEVCMESVVPVDGEGLTVGFMVMPGFVAAGRVVKSLVYLSGSRSA